MEIRRAMRAVAEQQQRTFGRTGVWVPCNRRKPPAWKAPRNAHGGKWLPFEVMVSVMEFSLDNAITRLGDKLLWQAQGIPMGDPISPGMTIITCAWMEQRWMSTLDKTAKESFCAARFMDDILMIYAAHAGWDHDGVMQQFTASECYSAPLTLTDAKDDTFLESTFELRDNLFRHWLKNENTVQRPHTVWRYQHFASATAFQQKRAVIMACMKKVQRMASDKEAIQRSAIQKFAEFARLEYPISVLRGTYMAAVTAEYEWIKVRERVSTWA